MTKQKLLPGIQRVSIFMSCHRWKIAWMAFGVLCLFLIAGTAAFWERAWLPNFLQAYATVTGLYLAVLVFVQGKSESDAALRMQLAHLQQLNQQEIEAMRELFQKQIDALAANTNRQIQQHAHETNRVVQKLENNSILLAELLSKQLEDTLRDTDDEITVEEKRLSDLNGWKLFRTPQEKQVQLTQQHGALNWLRQWRNYWWQKYDQLKRHFGPGLN
ncbi:MAG TPA: hypothetical protein PL070_01290 [Flavobacteriales bacterium]|nr:hypothetical protein [Flavobacteriales bacterium]